MKKKYMFYFIESIGDYFYSCSLDLSYSWSWEWNNFDDTILDILLWWLLSSTHDVIFFTWISFEITSSIKGDVSISLGFIPLFTKVLWLLMMHVLSLEIAIEVWISTLILFICDNDMIEAPIWVYYSLSILCVFPHKISLLEPFWPFIC